MRGGSRQRRVFLQRAVACKPRHAPWGTSYKLTCAPGARRPLHTFHLLPTSPPTPRHLDVLLVQRLVQVVEIDLPVKRVSHSVLDQALNLSTAEVLGALGQEGQVDCAVQEAVLRCLQVRGILWGVGEGSGRQAGWVAGTATLAVYTLAAALETWLHGYHPSGSAHLVGVDLQDLQAACLIRQPDLDLHLQTPWAQQRLVEHVAPACTRKPVCWVRLLFRSLKAQAPAAASLPWVSFIARLHVVITLMRE